MGDYAIRVKQKGRYFDGDKYVRLHERSVLLFLFVAVALMLASSTQLFAQGSEAEVDGLTLKEITPQVWRLTWTVVSPGACGDSITYSVFRGTNEDFEASEENQIASGITVAHYIAHEPKPSGSFYYRVIAIKVLGQCAPATLMSGLIVTYPLDLGGQYTVTIGDKTEICKASSTAEIVCPTLSYFHAVIASQWAHEFLIGCLSSDFENNNWTCVNLKLGRYHVAVHSLTATIVDAGYSKINIKTGKVLSSITPEFSVLAVLK
jgi:hypothetical protein